MTGIRLLNKCCKGGMAQGIFLVFLSGFTFSTVGFLTSIMAHKFNPYWITLNRYMVQAVGAVLYLLIKRLPILPQRGDWCMATLRCVCGSIAMTGVYFSLTHMELSDATSIFFSNAIWTSILAALILKEKFGIIDIIGLFLTVAGVLLITRPSFLFGDESGDVLPRISSIPLFIPVITALIASLASSVAYLTVRKLKHLHPMLISWLFGVVGVLTSLVCVAIAGGIGPDSTMSAAGPSGVSIGDITFVDWLLLLANGFCGLIGQGLVMKGMQTVPAGPAAALRTNDVAFAFMWQTLGEGRPAAITSILGALCIVSYTVILSVSKCRRNQGEPSRTKEAETEIAVLIESESDTEDEFGTPKKRSWEERPSSDATFQPEVSNADLATDEQLSELKSDEDRDQH